MGELLSVEHSLYTGLVSRYFIGARPAFLCISAGKRYLCPLLPYQSTVHPQMSDRPNINHSVTLPEAPVSGPKVARQPSVRRNKSLNRKSSNSSLYPAPTNDSLKGLRRDSLPLPSAGAELAGATDLVLPPDVAFGKDVERGDSDGFDEGAEDAHDVAEKEEEDPFLIDKFDDGDPRNPKNWNSAYRWMLTTIAGLLVLNSTFSSSSPSGISQDMMAYFTFSREVGE